MKTKIQRLALTAMLLSGSSMVMADNGTSIVGDLPGYGEDAYFDDDAVYAEDYSAVEENDADAYFDNTSYNDGEVAPVGHAEQSVMTRAPQRAMASRIASRQTSAHPAHATAHTPVAASQMQPASYHGGGSYISSDCGCGDGSCGGGCGVEMMMGDCGCGSTSCGGGCGSGSCGTSKRMAKLFDRCDSNAWASFETLLWFSQPRDTVPLILGSDAGTLPTLDEPSSRTLFGGAGENELSVGLRADAGFWLGDNVGVGGRFWILDESGDSFSYAGTGNDQSVGRSYFNTAAGFVGEDALLVAQDGIFQGNIEAVSELDILGAEAYARLRFGSGKNCTLDFIGGYSHFEIDDSLSINSLSVNSVINGGNPAGTRRTFSDRFNAENEFNGGQLGFDMVMHRGRWTVQSLTKVHLGNMDQRVSAAGDYTRQIPAGPLTSGSGGVLTAGNQFSTDRSVFAFAPEANFKLAYAFRPNVKLTVGYSFLYFDNVALASDAINRNVSGTTDIGTGAGSNTLVDFEDSSLWVHGIDLGFAIDF
ncbi:hypothetical protein K227x_47370 [Rubripirellula lacrimiformis]|uniref:Uncharacterized protein n=1 Tax=Rubripirellula lacrimiformis TaxID=1930273 RepID=A0A517NGX0_9BACT|nr:BBP7 family outer membrane beta-barrel protein [Rubripirellula lacrimiformis]QDT06328.1 hypothetical protein K227x_47370 [Rubripirellula lacrimiformis]